MEQKDIIWNTGEDELRLVDGLSAQTGEAQKHIDEAKKGGWLKKLAIATILLWAPVMQSCEQKEVAPKVLSEVESMTPQQWVEKNGYILERDFYLNDSKNIGHMTYKVVKGEEYYMLAPEKFEVNLDVYRDYKKTVVDRVLQATGGKEDVSDDMRHFFSIAGVYFEFPNGLIDSELTKVNLSEQYVAEGSDNPFSHFTTARRPINERMAFASNSQVEEVKRGIIETNFKLSPNIAVQHGNGNILMGK